MGERTCAVEGCDRPWFTTIYCHRHYRANWKYGDPLHVAQKHVTRTWADHPDGYRVMTIVNTKGRAHEVLYDHGDEDIVRSRNWYVAPRSLYVNSPEPDSGPAIYLSRMILGLAVGDPGVGDHRNGNRLDNRRANLRVVDVKTNVEHQAIVNGRGASRYRGVGWDKTRGLWTASAKHNRKRVSIGRYATEEAAAAAVARWRVENSIDPGY